MFFCGKKIGYLSVYKNGEKTEPAGFIKMNLEEGRIHISVRVKITEKISGKYPLFACTNKERIFVADIVLESGKGVAEYSTSGSRTEFTVDKSIIVWDELIGFAVQAEENISIEVRWQEEKKEREEKDPEAERKEDDGSSKAEQAPVKAMEDAVEKEPEVQIYTAEEYSEDKWEQLQKQFRRIHPFGDERVYIAIELKDFTILREEYQKLVHNSFLLHGFYNYRHLIVGKDNKM